MVQQDQSNPSTLVRQSELLRHGVVDSVTLENLGRVEVLWMFPQVNRVLGIVVKPGLFGGSRLVFKLPQIKSIKAQVLVTGEAEQTTIDKVQRLESLVGTEVWSQGGDRVGQITDCLFDLNSGVIIRYLLVPSSQFPQPVTQFTDGIYLLSPKQIQSFSRQRVLIADETVDELRLYSEGLRFKLATMTATLKQDYWDGATEEWRSLSQHVQSIAAAAKSRMARLAAKAKTTAQTLAQKVSTTVNDGVEQMEEAIADDDQPWNDPEWVDTMTDRVKTKGKEVFSSVKTTVQDRGKPMVDRFKTAQQQIKTSVASRLAQDRDSHDDSGLAEPTDDDWGDDWGDDPDPIRTPRDTDGGTGTNYQTINAGLNDDRLNDVTFDLESDAPGVGSVTDPNGSNSQDAAWETAPVNGPEETEWDWTEDWFNTDNGGQSPTTGEVTGTTAAGDRPHLGPRPQSTVPGAEEGAAEPYQTAPDPWDDWDDDTVMPSPAESRMDPPTNPVAGGAVDIDADTIYDERYGERYDERSPHHRHNVADPWDL